jgi:nucleoid-associated protein YgaU
MASTAPTRLGDGSRPFVIQRVDGEDEGTATMRVVPSAEPAPSAYPALPAAPQTWVTVAGESMWAKAESVLTEAWGRAPTDAEVVPYWQALIEVNRSRLADPGNPDLLFAEQAFEVPSPPPVP